MDISAKKLIFVVTQPVVGGAQKYVFDLAGSFSASGKYDVSVAAGAPFDGDLFKKLEDKKIKAHPLKFLKREISLFKDVSAFWELFRLFTKEKPDIVHLNSSKAGFLGSKAAWLSGLGRKRKPKVVFTAHGWAFKEDMKNWKRSVSVFLEYLSAKFKDRIICVSKDDFNEAVRRGVASPRKLSVIYNAVPDIEFLAKKKAKEEISRIAGAGLAEDAFCFVNLGRLYATKGLNYLIQAFQETRSKYSNSILIVFGDGPERENIKSQISSLKLEGSIFLAGDVSEVSKYLPAFDVLVLSSTKEGFPYAILEAGLAGVPIVSTNVGGVGEVIEDGKNGILIEKGDSSALAEAMKKIIENPSGAKKMASELRKVVSKDFNFKAMAERTEWIYNI